MTVKRLAAIMIGCHLGMWAGVVGAFFAQAWWPLFAVGATACAVALVSIVVWAAHLDQP